MTVSHDQRATTAADTDASRRSFARTSRAVAALAIFADQVTMAIPADTLISVDFLADA